MYTLELQDFVLSFTYKMMRLGYPLLTMDLALVDLNNLKRALNIAVKWVNGADELMEVLDLVLELRKLGVRG
jgi:hypothetical protein